MCGDGVEDRLGSGERRSRLVAGVERDKEVGHGLAGDVGGEVGRPRSKRAAGVRSGGDLPGDGQSPQVERLIRQDPLRPSEGIGADVQDGATQDLAVLRLLVRLMTSAEDGQARPAQTGERVSNAIVKAPVVTGQVSGSDPERGLSVGRKGRVEWEVGVQRRLLEIATGQLPPALRRGRGGGAWTGPCQARATATSGGRWLSCASASRPSAR